MIVKNLEQSVKFYHDLFGFEVRKEQPEMKSKIIGKDTIKLCLYEDANMKQGNGLNHFGFHIENFNDIVEKCKEMNIEMPYDTVNWGESRSIYIIDPNGYNIELSDIQGGGL
jgi:lactoylglutathione lyase